MQLYKLNNKSNIININKGNEMHKQEFIDRTKEHSTMIATLTNINRDMMIELAESEEIPITQAFMEEESNRVKSRMAAMRLRAFAENEIKKL